MNIVNKVLLVLFFWEPLSAAIPEKPMVVLITSYNNIKWYRKNLESVFQQRYTNYRVIYVDDHSIDETADRVESFASTFAQSSNFMLVRNEERQGAMENIYQAVSSCEDDEIIVSLDGDDWFYDDRVLERLNVVYSTKEVWLTHGTLIEYPMNALGWSIPIPADIVSRNAFREYRCVSHLRTFYTWLFKKVRVEDLMYNGTFFVMTWDQAAMFPMIEMAAERHHFFSEINYVYNTSNPINDNKVDPQLQRDLEAYIRAMPKYPRLKDKYESP